MPNRILRENIIRSKRVCSVSKLAELLYVHILVRADDFGCYDADPMIVARDAYPGRPETPEDVASWLDELAGADLIGRYEAGGRQYMLVYQWKQRTRNQRRKYPLPPPALIEHDGHVSGERQTAAFGDGDGDGVGDGVGKEEGGLVDVVPENLTTPDFLRTWDEWVRYRKEVKHKLTPTTKAKQLKKLAKYGPATAIAMLEQSMVNQWRGIFEVKDGQGYQRQAVGRSGLGAGGVGQGAGTPETPGARRFAKGKDVVA